MTLVTIQEKQFLDSNATLINANSVLGTVVTANKAATQANSLGTDLATLTTDFNALLAKLKAAGIML